MAPELPSIWHFSRLPGSLTQNTDRLPAPSSNPDISRLKTPPATLMAREIVPRLKGVQAAQVSAERGGAGDLAS
jgi:hypothetical protein